MTNTNLPLSALILSSIILMSPGLASALDNDGDGIDDTVDLCLVTEVPETLVPTKQLKKNRYALTGNNVPNVTTFESTNNTVFTTIDTGGCSCDQIIDELGLGNGHRNFGCSKSAMLSWVATVEPAAADDMATVVEDDPATLINVLANDIPATITGVTQPANGTVVNNATDVTYEPDADYCNAPPGTATDDFTYTLLGGSMATVAMTVTCVNDDPTDIALDNTSVNENQAVGTVVGTFSSTDVDSAGPFVYTLVAGAGDTDNVSFAIVGDQLQSAAVFDFETQNSFSIRVQTDDGSGGLFEEAFTITVNDLNDAPTDIALDNTSVNENQAVGTAVGTFSSTDVDSAGPFVYTLVAGAGDTDNAQFSIVGDQLQTAAVLDFETTSSCTTSATTCSIRVQTDDGNGGVFAETFVINITNVNEAPTDIALDNTDVDENQPVDTAVGTFSTTDVDSAGPFTYTLVAGAGDTDNASFAIVGDQLQTAAIFDFDVQNSFSIRVQTDDGAGGTFEEAFTITVNSLNNDPTDIALDNASVDENQPAGTAVGTFSTTDADASDTHTYTLVAGAGDTDNAQFAIVGDQLQTAAVLNFEAADNCLTSATSCSIRVETDDGNGGMFEKSFIINIGDVNDNPTDIALDNSSVDENQPAGTAVGTFTTTDEDPADTHTYTLVAGAGDTDNAQFMIVGGQLQTAAVLDFETTANCTTSTTTCSIRVQTDDGNGGIFEESFIISINDVAVENVAPEAMDDSYTGAIGNTNFALVAALSGTSTPPTVQLVGSVLGNDSDPDAGDMLAVAAATVATTMGGSATIDADGRFVYAPAAGFPSAAADSFDYEVCDNGTPILCDTGTVNITGTGIVWYVDDSSPNNPGTGTASDPFQNLSSASGAPTAPGETIFVYAGTQTTGITLQNNQELLGQGVALVVNTITLVGANTRPVIANAGGTAIVLAMGNTVRGLDIAGSGASQGIVGSGFGTATIDNVAIATDTGTALSLDNGNAAVTLDSVTSTGATSNSAISLSNTGADEIMVIGDGSGTVGSGGTIANKTDDAIIFINTAGKITLMDMIIQDIGDTVGGFDTRSGHDAIHGQTVTGGLTLNNVTIRRISDNCINGALFADGVSETTWNGLDIFDSTIEDCNRWHVAGVADSQDEAAVRIQGLSGSVTIDNTTFARAGSHLDLSTAATGSLTMNVTESMFDTAFKEFTSGSVVATGEDCINVLVEGSATANVTIGGAGLAANTFINCGTSSINVAKDTVPAGDGTAVVIVDNNVFRVTDQTSANGIFGNTPQGGVALRAGPGGITTFDAIVSNNTFGIAVGPDDDILSTTDEIANANGLTGNVGLVFESGVSQVRVNNNTFNGSINAPWFNRADNLSGTQTSAAVLYENNNYRGRADYCCDGGFTFRVPGIPYRSRVRNGGKLDITLVNDSFALHDQFFFAQTENLEFESRVVGGTMCVSLNNTTSPDGYEFDELVGTINLYQGAVNNAATGPCGVGATSDCQTELADDGNRGGPNGYIASGTPNAALNPPFVDVDNGSIAIVGTACTVPVGGIF